MSLSSAKMLVLGCHAMVKMDDVADCVNVCLPFFCVNIKTTDLRGARYSTGILR